MPDLSARLSHLEALREGVTLGFIDYEEGEGGCGIPCTPDGCLENHPNGYATLSGLSDNLEPGEYFVEHAEFIVELVNASHWLIPLAQQAERLAEAVQRDGNLPDYSDVLEAALAVFRLGKRAIDELHR